MRYSDIALKKMSPETLVSLYNSGKLNLSKTEIKDMLNDLQKNMRAGVFMAAMNGCIIGMLIAPKQTIDYIRRKGLFRYSSYVTGKCIVKDLVAELLTLVTKHRLCESSWIGYLETVKHLSFLREEYVGLRLTILKEISCFQQNYKGYSIVKTVAAYADSLFFLNYEPVSESKGDMNTIYSRSKEDICSATSYVIHMLSSLGKLSANGGKVADEYIFSDGICKLLLPAALIEDYKEIEILVEHFGYRIEKNEHRFRLLPPVEHFERDLRLGYIRTDIQRINSGLYFAISAESEEEILSIRKIAESIAEANLIHFEFLAGNDYPRYRLQMPGFTYKMLYDKFFSNDNLFEEEAYHLSWIFREQLLDEHSLKGIRLTDNLLLLDFLKMNRYFLFMHTVYQHHFKKLKEVDKAWLLHSLVPLMDEEHLYMMFEGFGNNAMTDDFLNIISWGQQDEGVFDIQYQPILFLEGQFLVPFNILGQMNVIRNLYASEYRKQNKNLLTDGRLDPLADRLSSTLNSVGIENIKGFNYAGGDIDIVAAFEGALILVECKHSLHPGDFYELRRTYDYVKKAESQLDRALEHYYKNDLLKQIERSFGRSLSEITSVLTLIVTSNRVLSGNNFRHPVRDINELSNFISKGTFVTNEGEFSLYNSDHFQASELKEYLENDTVIINHMRNVMEKYTKYYRSSKYTLEYETYLVNIPYALEELTEFCKTLRRVDGSDV